MLETRENCRHLLRCPRTGEPLQLCGSDVLIAPSSGYRYPVVDGVPILIDTDRSVVSEADVCAGARSNIERPRYASGLGRIAKRLVKPRSPTAANIGKFIGLLKRLRSHPTVLVVGGASIGQGMQALYDVPDVRVIAFDIYQSQAVHFVADAHQIALGDGVVDGVVVQAVLEHVLRPEAVVGEIWRVLGDGGLVYSETPFMQHVHEGAYDFTRFTDSGHRHLFRKFDLITSGAVGGVGTQLMWSIDYFFRGLLRSRTAGKVAKLAFFWLHLLDRYIPSSHTADAASGYFFLGRKSQWEVGPREIIGYYRGAQH